MPSFNHLSQYFDNLSVNEGENIDLASSEEFIPLRARIFEGELRMRELKPFHIDGSHIEKIQKNWAKIGSKARTTEMCYVNSFKTMIWLEEKVQSEFLKQFKQDDIQLIQNSDPKFVNIFRLKNDKKMEKINDAIDDNLLDRFVLKEMECRWPPRIQGQIKGHNQGYIFLEIEEKYIKHVKIEVRYEIEFELNRLPFQVQHLALSYVIKHRLVEKLFNNPSLDLNVTDSKECPAKKANGAAQLERGLVSDLNEEQREAVANIVAARNGTLPYILYGPPGTGKTQTLVAAIQRIVQSTKKNVLVCANSNAACDEITVRLIKILTTNQLLRFYAKKFDDVKLKAEIQSYSNWNGKDFHHPVLKHLLEFRVIVCTLCTAACLTRADAKSGPIPFSHIIIDECASTHETMALVAIAGLCTDNDGVQSSIVLAGDPKQLDAVTKSDEAAALGYKTSLLEQLCLRPLYKRDPVTKKFNPKYITQLVKNYRSHSTILHMPNNLFYEGTLQAKAGSESTDWFIGSRLLCSNGFPIIFHDVKGICKRTKESFSSQNIKEMNVVVDYLKDLLWQNQNGRWISPSDIGVVSPYKLQCKHIAIAIRKNELGDIAVGTAEVFQGQERPIMIVSTVRSGGRNLDFVSEPKRLNVMITRAKSLLIIVGNRSTLMQDSNWAQFIQYCTDNNALINWR